jgi:4-amino-4-deoxy-L-arabinose transferase-like glycosyltransferase
MVGIVVAVALAVRIAFVATAQVQAPLRADAGHYAQYAKNLVEHGVFSLATTTPPPPDSFRSPGYPAVLATCRWLGGEAGWYSLAIALQVGLGALTVLLTYRIARTFVGFAPALVAAVLCALSPHLVVSTAYVLTECVTTFAVVAAMWLCVGGTPRRWLLAAVVSGAAVLCNEALVFLPFVLGAVCWRHGRALALAFVALACVPFAAWSLRNQVQPLALRGSERVTASISHGSYPGMVFQDSRLFGYPYREDPEQPAFGASWSGLSRVLGPRIAADPWRYVWWYAVEKPVWLWSWPLVQGRDVLVYEVANSPYERQPVMQASHALMRWLHVPVMVLALLGAAVAVVRHRRGPQWEPFALALVAIAGTLAYVPVIPDPRYLQPIRPLLFVLAAATLGAVAQALRSRRGIPADTPSFAARPTAP